ncbi:MAG: S41 family peptidase [Planctomycetes bacterium]|nr:S41 family peptidase [Planctomycetota bacterium]
MMRTSMLQRLLYVLALSTLASFSRAQGSGDLRALIDQRVQAASGASVESALEQAGNIAGLATDENRAALQADLDRWIARAAELSEPARILVLAARSRVGEADLNGISAQLVALVGSKDESVGQAAASLLSDRVFRTLRDNEIEPAVKALGDGAKDAQRSPSYRLACAVALHVQGRAEGQRTARALMMEFLASSDAGLRAQGALALAEVGDLETPRKQLESLALVPTSQGRLAAAFLKQEDIRRIYDRRAKNDLEYAKKSSEDSDPAARKDMAILEKLIDLVRRKSLEGEVVKRQDLIDAACDGLMRSLDEHSSFMTGESYKKFEQDLLAPEYGGIGAYVGEDPEDHIFTITRPIYSGPAYKAGLHSDDKIVRIDDWPTVTPSGSHEQEDIIKRLKGKPGTSVKLYIWRRGMDPSLIDRPTEDMALTITRAEITIPPVNAQLLPGKIGLVELSSFTRVASEELSKQLKGMLDQGMKGVILDLRNDSGGLLTEACNVANLMLPKGKLVVSTENRADKSEKLYTREEPLIPADMPVAVLINRFSASASEIVSGALQDHERAVLVGQRSYGKGSVQNLLPIPGEDDDRFIDENGNGRFDNWEKLTLDRNGNGEFDFAPRARMTIARYLLPSGRSIHRQIAEDGTLISEGGVVPELVVVPRRIEGWRAEEMYRLVRREHKIRDWVEQNYAKDREVFKQLATCDEDDVSRYPGFQELFDSLKTVLPQQDVRMLVRSEVRRRVQDDRGAAFPDGDFEEDLQLQAAITSVLDRLHEKSSDIPEFARTFDAPAPKEAGPQLVTAASRDDQLSRLKNALTLVTDAKEHGQIDAKTAAELERALQDALKPGDQPR